MTSVLETSDLDVTVVHWCNLSIYTGYDDLKPEFTFAVTCRCTYIIWHQPHVFQVSRLDLYFSYILGLITLGDYVWLRMACVDIRALWRPGFLQQFLWMVSAMVSHRCLRRICPSFDGVVPGGSPLRGCFRVVPISCRRCLNHRLTCCVWHIGSSGIICSPKADLQHTHIPFSVEDCEAQQVIPCGNEVFLQWPAYTQLRSVDQMHGLTKPHEWKCPILSQFHDDYVIHVWHFRYGQER